MTGFTANIWLQSRSIVYKALGILIKIRFFSKYESLINKYGSLTGLGDAGNQSCRDAYISLNIERHIR